MARRAAIVSEVVLTLTLKVAGILALTVGRPPLGKSPGHLQQTKPFTGRLASGLWFR